MNLQNFNGNFESGSPALQGMNGTALRPASMLQHGYD